MKLVTLNVNVTEPSDLVQLLRNSGERLFHLSAELFMSFNSLLAGISEKGFVFFQKNLDKQHCNL